MQGDDIELEQEEAQDLSVDDFMFFCKTENRMKMSLESQLGGKVGTVCVGGCGECNLGH